MGFGLLKGASEKVGVEAGLKAGLEATGQAVKQKALGMAAKVSKYIPGISKDAVAGL